EGFCTERTDQRLTLGAAGDLHADEKVRGAGVADAVVELGDAVLTESGAEAAEAAALFGDGHGEHRLALLAEFGAFGDEAEAIEIHVGAGDDRHQRAIARTLGCDVLLEAGE